MTQKAQLNYFSSASWSLNTVQKKDNNWWIREYLEMSSSEQRYLLLSLRLSSRAFLASWLSLLTSWIFCSSSLLSASLSCRWSRSVPTCSMAASRRPRRSCGLHAVQCLQCEMWLQCIKHITSLKQWFLTFLTSGLLKLSYIDLWALITGYDLCVYMSSFTTEHFFSSWIV